MDVPGPLDHKYSEQDIKIVSLALKRKGENLYFYYLKIQGVFVGDTTYAESAGQTCWVPEGNMSCAQLPREVRALVECCLCRVTHEMLTMGGSYAPITWMRIPGASTDP